MPDNPADELTKFDRQRRNLTISWAVLFFYQTVHPQLDRIVLPGVQATVVIESPELVLLWIVGVHLYFLIRYYQFFNAAVVATIGMDVRAMQAEIATIRAKKIGEKLVTDAHPQTRNAGLHLNVNPKGLDQRSWIFTVDSIAYQTGSGATARGIPEIKIAIKGLPFWWINQLGLLKVSWKRPFFTEYYLPFVLPHICWLWAVLT